MGLFLGRQTRQVWPEPPIPPFLGASPTGTVNVNTNPDQALTVPTVWACVNLLAGSVSSLNLETYRRTQSPDAVPKRIPDPSVILEPDDGMFQSEWLYMCLVSLLLRGNTYGQVTARDSYGQARAVHLLHPDKVSVDIAPDGRVVYSVNAPNGQRRVIPNEDMWHLRGLTMPGQVVGLSPISYAAAVLGLDLSSRRFANGFFEGDGVPKALVEVEQQVDQSKARQIKDRVMATFRNREPLVLGLGMKYTAIQVKPEESQFLATQQATVTQICRYFGVPATMVDGATGHSMTYTNTEQRGIDFLKYSLSPWLKRLEDGIARLLPGPQFVRFNVSALLRLDAHTQSQVDLFDLAGKIVAPSEIRARRGLPPMTDEQKQEAELVPLTISPLGRPAAAGPLTEDPLAATTPPTGDNIQGA